jgi:D-alanyl-D-alanine carboxypeptidase
LARRAGAALALLALGVGVIGCGEEGVASGATVRVYLGAPLCAEAQGELERQGGSAGDVEVRAICNPVVERGGHLHLATIGAAARRATEDSTTIAFVEPPGPANRFSRTILEEAGIAWTTASSGATAVQRILNAVSEAGSGSLRDEVRAALEPS